MNVRYHEGTSPLICEEDLISSRIKDLRVRTDMCESVQDISNSANNRNLGLTLSIDFFLKAVGSLSATAFAQIASSRKQPRLHSYDIKAVYPHNPNAFTQGLEYEKLCFSAANCTDILWESTGNL